MAGQCRAQGLAALGKGGVDNRPDLSPRLIGDRPRSIFKDVDAHQPGFNIGRRPKDVLANRAGLGDLAIKARLDRGHAINLAAGLGGETVRHLQLDHHQHAANGGECLQQMQQDRHSDVIREVGHEGSRLRDVRIRHAQRVLFHYAQALHILRGALGHGIGQLRCQAGIDLHRGNVPHCLYEAKGQRSQSGAYLEDAVCGIQLRRGDDAPDSIRVMQKVLPQLLGGHDVELLREGADLYGAQKRGAGGISHAL